MNNHHDDDDKPIGLTRSCLYWATGLALILWLMVWAIVVTVAQYL